MGAKINANVCTYSCHLCKIPLEDVFVVLLHSISFLRVFFMFFLFCFIEHERECLRQHEKNMEYSFALQRSVIFKTVTLSS